MAKKDSTTETTEEVVQTAPAYAFTQLGKTVEASTLQEANEKVQAETPKDPVTE